ncbi:hypothetical protein Bca4012_018660 [Brassica carinata]|uniref:chitinase n=1 Tax=Brassica carinata TaxID=52824 RepID=A0A8X7WN21_BRACI|nr:hypothetical protein Bca52824_002965 [Brassica carinata]
MKTNLFLFLIFSLLLSFSSAKQSGRSHTHDLSSIITRSQFEEMLKHRNDSACPARGFYTYDAFIAAARSFPGFGTTGATAARKREIAAFFGQTSHETTGGWPSPVAQDGTDTWGYCSKQEDNPSSDYCSPSTKWPCARGKRYFGRGPMQLNGNINYGQCGKAIGADLLNRPDILTKDAAIAFKSAIWFWMTAQPPNPSCHAVISGKWKPSVADRAVGRVPGYAMINIIIAPGECGIGADTRVADRIGFYARYCKMFGVTTGKNIACYGF